MVKKAKSKLTEEQKNTNEALARALADYQNLIKRVEKEKLEVVLRANKNIIERLLPIVDSIEHAALVHNEDPGLKMILDQSYKLLNDSNVQVIEPRQGDEFDALTHEVVEIVEGGKPHTIAKLLSKGYKWNAAVPVVIRPAKVAVYK